MTVPAAPRFEEDSPVPLPPAGMLGTAGPLLQLIQDRRVAFIVVGCVNTVIGLTWFALFDATIGHLWGYMATLGAAHVASVLCAFVLYRRFVFRVRGHMLLDLGRFEVVNLTSLGINAVALPALVEGFHLAPLVAQVLITSVTMVVSYIGHRDFSFHRKPAPLLNG